MRHAAAALQRGGEARRSNGCRVEYVLHPDGEGVKESKNVLDQEEDNGVPFSALVVALNSNGLEASTREGNCTGKWERR
ncbi:hypothetical protein MUK42_35485 [Musa troglodytarum]|uniref:Uncharacterized protein n=1 Tax=Musa troglodytarum TaxID=320322 RepID=A0A9E7KXB8_9LILI|nr:hypothetical protein MUK42_35485 [Musa troglodytarum]